MGGGPDINYPQQPTYGESLADALKAQAEFLKGTGDFAETGSLESLLPLEESLRKKTAQIDTDVLRQTLLGTRQESTSGTYDEEGRLVVGYEGGKEATTETKTVKPKVDIIKIASGATGRVGGAKIGKGINTYEVTLRDPNTNSIIERGTTTAKSASQVAAKNQLELNGKTVSLQEIQSTITIPPKDAVPVYGKDPNGNIIVDKTKAGQTETIPATFAGDGMINLLGDSRNVQEFTTRRATEADVASGLATEVGESITEASGDRRAGFDAEGNFLGLSALAEDIQRGNLSRQREADLADVERLAGRYSDVMEEFKPGTVSGLEGARELLEEQKEAMTTGGGTIDVPTGSTFGGRVEGLQAQDTTVADPLQLQANTQFDQEIGRGQDSLRSMLLGEAREALGQGLTEREQAQIADAARARQTLMGRTFDQSGAIAEAEARIAEDNARRMQNRAFAQSALGQEAGLQQGDITRGMAQESEQAGLQQRADLAQAQLSQQQALAEMDSAQRAQLANQAQQQQANQFGVGAKMDAQRLNEQLRQQGLGNYIAAVGNLAQIEQQTGLDPFQALLGRGGGTALQQGQSVFGQANYGLQSGPQYLNPEAGLGFISQMAANDANMYAANVAADASRSAGMFGGLGSFGGPVLGGLIQKGKIF